MHGAHGLVAQPQFLDGAAPEVLGHHVELGRQTQEQLPPGIGSEVDGDAALTEVVAQERRSDLSSRGFRTGRLGLAARLTSERLHLDDVGTQPGQDHGGVGQRLHLLGGEHADAIEWPSLLWRPSHVVIYHIRPCPEGVRAPQPVTTVRRATFQPSGVRRIVSWY